MTNSNQTDTDSRQQTALDYLRILREDSLTNATSDAVVKRVRLHYVRLARDCGVTLKDIGDALNITEGAVRAMLARDK